MPHSAVGIYVTQLSQTKPSFTLTSLKEMRVDILHNVLYLPPPFL